MWTMHHYESDPAQSSMYFQLEVPVGIPTSYFKMLLQNKLIADTGSKSTGTSQAWLQATLSTEQIPLSYGDDTTRFRARKPLSSVMD